jgi:hypothetical protein
MLRENTTAPTNFHRVGRGWARFDPDGAAVCVAHDGDFSPAVECNTNYLPGHCYDARCSCCYLGHNHSSALHDQNLTEYLATHKEVIQ